jgi:hypothetical protein
VEGAIANEGARQEARFTKDLEAVADAEEEFTGSGVLFHGLHDGREAGDGPAAEVIAIGKSAGQDDEVVAGERFVLVPDIIGSDAHFGEGEDTVLVAIGSGEANDGGFQGSGEVRVES